MKRKYPDFSLDVAPFSTPLPPAPPTEPVWGETAPTSVTDLAKVRPEETPLRLRPRLKPGEFFSRANENPGDLPLGLGQRPIRGHGPGAVLEEGLGAKVVSLGKNMILGFSPRVLGFRERQRLEKGEQFPWLTEAEKEKRRKDRLDAI